MSESVRSSPRLLIPMFLGIACVMLDIVIVQQHWRSLPQRELDLLLIPAVILTSTQIVRIYKLRDALRQLQAVTQMDLAQTLHEALGTTESLAVQLLSLSFVVEMLLVATIGYFLR